MKTVADDIDPRDWVADCNGEGQEQAVRDGGDSGVMMMAAAAEDGCVRQTVKAGNNSSRQQRHARLGTMKVKDKSGRQETAETRSGNDGCGGRRWRRWTMTVVEDDNSDKGGRQQQTTKEADKNVHKIGWRTTRGKEESRRQTTTALDKRLISPPGRECKKIHKSSL